MPKTLVLQSHTNPLPHNWLTTCITSVKHWAEHNNYDYQFLNDELFDYVPWALVEKPRTKPIIATDLARIKALQAYLAQGFETVIWCDADFLIFDPARFVIPDEEYALGREVWVQADRSISGKLTVRVKVHNAFLMFRAANAFLDF